MNPHPEGRCADCGGGKPYWRIGKESSIGDPEWGMYVTPDDPLRDTPEKARAYYEDLFARYPHLKGYPTSSMKGVTAADAAAVKVLFDA